MILSFRCKETERLFRRRETRRFGNIAAVARRKLRMLGDAEKLEDLAAVPGNRLEALAGVERPAQYPHQRSVARLFCLAGGRGGAGRDRRLAPRPREDR